MRDSLLLVNIRVNPCSSRLWRDKSVASHAPRVVILFFLAVPDVSGTTFFPRLRWEKMVRQRRTDNFSF